jgi:hypothetical protein
MSVAGAGATKQEKEDDRSGTYNLAHRKGDPSKIELKLRPDDEGLVEVEFE